VSILEDDFAIAALEEFFYVCMMQAKKIFYLRMKHALHYTTLKKIHIYTSTLLFCGKGSLSTESINCKLS
jgi:hypothetical protein